MLRVVVGRGVTEACAVGGRTIGGDPRFLVLTDPRDAVDDIRPPNPYDETNRTVIGRDVVDFYLNATNSSLRLLNVTPLWYLFTVFGLCVSFKSASSTCLCMMLDNGRSMRDVLVKIISVMWTIKFSSTITVCGYF
jgi:hypothetical protein